MNERNAGTWYVDGNTLCGVDPDDGVPGTLVEGSPEDLAYIAQIHNAEVQALLERLNKGRLIPGGYELVSTSVRPYLLQMCDSVEALKKEVKALRQARDADKKAVDWLLEAAERVVPLKDDLPVPRNLLVAELADALASCRETLHREAV